jgi:hypothetical protein
MQGLVAVPWRPYLFIRQYIDDKRGKFRGFAYQPTQLVLAQHPARDRLLDRLLPELT